MIDSVLKGTGNSRFLKSAVPAGTSWADALAMLQAGTFPIDFNGINAEGFQQVGTPLNKANLLKDATAAQIGLPPSTTPDGMFQALGNTGELHVWRKTVKNAADVPAGYTITDKIGVGSVVSNSARITISYSDAVDVDDKGNVSLREPITTETYSVRELNQLGATNPTYISGKFFTATTYKGIMYRKPSVSWVFGHDDDGTYFHGGFVVNGYAKVPAGTTTTYPVSTNPNAYQEGSDAKPAGYVLGNVVTGSFRMGASNASYPYLYYVSSALSVADDGTISIDSSTGTQIKMGYSESWTTDTWKTAIAGKFVQYKEQIGASSGTSSPDKIPPFNTRGIIVFIPSDVEVSKSDGAYYIDRYQPVTGYAAIPAGTTIEYLGKLGDKARVQVVSYVGTGTYGSDHPTTVTFDFVPKVVIAHCKNDAQYRFIAPYGIKSTLVRNSLNDKSLDITWKNKTMSYKNNSPGLQMNTSGLTYIVVAIG